MRNTGFRDVAGSWKIYEIFAPRILRSCSLPIFRTSWPSRRISPPLYSPGGVATSFASDKAVTLLPQPLSPTNASVSPRRIVKLTPSTACTSPSSVRKLTFRLRTSKRVLVEVIYAAFSPRDVRHQTRRAIPHEDMLTEPSQSRRNRESCVLRRHPGCRRMIAGDERESDVLPAFPKTHPRNR